nr:immunoglobulin light chain junction region [Macaca mulatta]MOW03043.1 immunoglobulin light chain junction region [Macaca mulatta]MOW03408.1 immunoglobulin light chain junction region [Macaca mulatta]MOW03608.1 immunoglobulin light chain junction region [Macaca mulatta]MOW15806.1 immunoglobulin light chain junction region [Macaca mulatta]
DYYCSSYAGSNIYIF